MENSIFELANILKPVASDVKNGKRMLCLSTSYLNCINKAVDADLDVNASFHTISSNKTALVRDVQFLLDLIDRTVFLKITPDKESIAEITDIRQFRNLKVLEIHKLDIDLIFGLQKLRSQLQEISCIHSIRNLSDILEQCGGDKSSRYNWSELKKAKFSHNGIKQIDDSFEYTLSLHTLDLSHNKLKKVDIINQLPNLKHINLSYNELESVPVFGGPIRNNLQVLLLNNNYIEDLSPLTNINNLVQLDLTYNQLVNHNCLLSISHLISLQCLQLKGNALSYHPHHRTLTCNHLHRNTATVRFLLDGVILSKTEQTMVGSLYPILKLQTQLENEDLEGSTISTQDKQRRVRNVKIREDGVSKKVAPISTPPPNAQHLEIKRQVEQLKEEYGEKWLHSDSGLRIQDVLGFEKSSVLLSSTPSDNNVQNFFIETPIKAQETTRYETPNTTVNGAELMASKTLYDESSLEPTVYNSVASQEGSDASDGEDVFSGGEEGIFLAINKEGAYQVFVVLTESHISERDVTTSKERARWHVNTIVSCTGLEDSENTVRIEFDTLRRDRKQRIYELEEGDYQNFYSTITQKLKEQKQDEQKVSYQCMKCSETFLLKNMKAVLVEQSVECPKCNSNLVVESI